LIEEDVEVLGLGIDGNRVSWVVERTDVEKAAQMLHEEFVGEVQGEGLEPIE